MKTIFFDLGNVLIRFSREAMIGDLARLLGQSESQLAGKLSLTIQASYERGEITTGELCDRLASDSRVSESDLIDAAGANFVAIPEMLRLVEVLSDSGVTLGLLTNTNDAHFRYIEKKFSLFPRFDFIVASHQIGVIKPDRRFFTKALSVGKQSASQCLFVDDLQENCDGAQEVGIDSHCFKGMPGLLEFLTKKSPEILERCPSVREFAKV